MLKRILESRQLLQQQRCCHLPALGRWDFAVTSFSQSTFSLLSLLPAPALCTLASGLRCLRRHCECHRAAMEQTWARMCSRRGGSAARQL